ncbi:hemerythrin domain-containing protein [Janibacter terrae]|uniref:Hemerythrin domain-containing protein n=1 Tax=Janibacter terrae TaxID=103817 RepID=A0ABZ2FL01_9MICO|nr:hemerythrin domain-containing protein [Janibacter terrae]MBA4085488.1 hemerythrin domain-containing protein [Kytococcus sp.]HBO54141.1 hemerythrin domain-containing protein [Janibacter terrae]
MCSYCGCQSIDMIGRFTAEHEELINATGLLRRAAAAGDTAEVVELVDDLAAMLAPHTGAEEAGLFTVLRRDEDFTGYIDALCSEHVGLDGLLARVRAGDLAAADRFYTELRSHIEREEDGLFPASLTTLRGDDWDEVDALTAAAAPTSPLAAR